MSKVSNVVVIVMCLMALSVVAVNSAGQVKKINEPEYGKEYNLNVTGSASVIWDIPVNYGDNISVTITEVPGKPLSCYVSFTSIDNLYYKSAWCETYPVLAALILSNRTIWVVVADDMVIQVTLNNYMVADSQANYTINKVNATSSQSVDISKLESMVSSLNQTVNALNSSLSALTINISNLSAHLQQTDGNLSALQEELYRMRSEFKSLSDNLTALKARLDALNIPDAVNISGIQDNLTELSASYDSLYENITMFANRTNITYENITYENQTLVTNETVVYAYDNGTVGNISKGLDDLGKRLAEINKSLPEEIAKVNGNVDKLKNTTKGRESISKEMGEATGTAAAVGLGAGVLTGAGTSMAIGRRNSRVPVKGSEDEEDTKPYFPKSTDKEGGQ